MCVACSSDSEFDPRTPYTHPHLNALFTVGGTPTRADLAQLIRTDQARQTDLGQQWVRHEVLASIRQPASERKWRSASTWLWNVSNLMKIKKVEHVSCCFERVPCWRGVGICYLLSLDEWREGLKKKIKMTVWEAILHCTIFNFKLCLFIIFVQVIIVEFQYKLKYN